jgi:hypothetical protein
MKIFVLSCALARAAAIVPIAALLERCTVALGFKEIKADCGSAADTAQGLWGEGVSRPRSQIVKRRPL